LILSKNEHNFKYKRINKTSDNAFVLPRLPRIPVPAKPKTKRHTEICARRDLKKYWSGIVMRASFLLRIVELWLALAIQNNTPSRRIKKKLFYSPEIEESRQKPFPQAGGR
jgi:hypothetical protein